MVSLAWLRAVGDVVLPRTCAGCERDGTWWCAACAAAVAREPRGFVLDDSSGLRVHAVAPYRGVAGRALVAAKERGVVALVPQLGPVLARAVAAAAAAARDDVTPDDPRRTSPLVLVPAPSRPAAVRARGADVVADLARACAERMRAEKGVAVAVARCLVHDRAVVDQTTLDVARRAENLAGALRVRPVAAPLLAGRTIVVVDDVVTSGATLREAARALREAAGERAGLRVGAATLAAAGPFATAFEAGSGDRVVARRGDG